jgi:hypothetical protein
LAGRKDEYVKECFQELPSPKDGYAIEDCTDPWHRRVLAFLVPILYLEKPNRIIVTMGNTIFGALNGGRKVNWSRQRDRRRRRRRRVPGTAEPSTEAATTGREAGAGRCYVHSEGGRSTGYLE